MKILGKMYKRIELQSDKYYKFTEGLLVESSNCFGFEPMYVIVGLDYIFVYGVYHYNYGQGCEFKRFNLDVFEDVEFKKDILDYIRTYK